MSAYSDPDATIQLRRPVGTMTAHPAPSRDDRAGEPERTILLPRISTDPVDELVERVRPQLGQAVDALQVAAALEAAGHTDRGAQVEYGYADVFTLASEVYQRLGPRSPVAEAATSVDSGRRRWEGLRPIWHGPLYLLPSATFPAVLTVVGRPGLVLGLVLAGTVGWVFSGVTAYAAYRLLGLGRPRSAARLLRAAALIGPSLGVLLGVAVLSQGGLPLAAMMVCQLAYQMASTLLIFYRRETWLAVTQLPAFLFGAAHLLLGDPTSRRWAVAAAVVCVLAAFAVALYATRAPARADEPAPRDPLLPAASALVGVAGYGLCSAALLFHAQTAYLLDRLDIAAAAAPLLLSMGFVEWRTSRFRVNAVALTRQARRPEEFAARIWRAIGRDVAACLAVAAVLGLVLLAVFAQAGLLSPAGVVMTAAHVALAGTYYLAFLLAGRGRYGWLCLSMVVVIAVHVGVGGLLGVAPLLGQDGSALVDTSLHLGSVLLLQALFALGLLPVIGQVRHYR
ncbi:hypothetical protein GA0074692_2288 [Micromonospora pallida]|uniref:Uncharacterized protein n=1 Tax=Micromonospora pallida TaxID=145854 RepID=A0A1C6SC96_9ACTN|nr:hypothetical protein [Micromonospora pallida]SCL27091.1 hypothetical protein GA0074692_2288 [Micromonospora pallida]